MTRTASANGARLGALAAATILLLSGGVAVASADTTEDPGLGQVIDPNQQQGTGQVLLPAGHADFGPTSGTGEWKLQIHDDTSVPRYWRNAEDVVFQVGDAALLEVPDDGAFSFLGMPAGSPVHVVPQTEAAGVPWVGWNTQEPSVLDSIDLGATLRIHAIEGPGDVVVYLQGGNFGAPQQLWSTHESFPQDAWIEVNTHTHANWVFSAPGVYLVDAEFLGDTIAGESMSARDTLRFAVGDGTDPAQAFAASLLSPGASSPRADDGETGSATPVPESGDAVDTVWYLVAGGALLLVVAVVAVSVRTSRARRRATSGNDAA